MRFTMLICDRYDQNMLANKYFLAFASAWKKMHEFDF